VKLFDEMVKLSKRKKKAIVGALCLLFTSPLVSSGIPFAGSEIMRKVYNPRHGRGYGAPGYRRAKHKRRKPVDVWGILQQFGDKNFESLTRMYLDEFKFLLGEVAHLENDTAIKNVATRLTFENKVLCLFLWVVKYCDYPVLSFLFGSSNAVMSGLITTLLPHLAGYFALFPMQSRVV